MERRAPRQHTALVDIPVISYAKEKQKLFIQAHDKNGNSRE
jgi:hypothetical protein